MPKGHLLLVLHAHLPYVHHPEYDRFLEELWLFEAITETYIPLIKFLDRLHSEEVPFKLTLSISPTLGAMLESRMLRERYTRHLDLCLRLAEAEITRTQHWPDVNRLARMYHTLFCEARHVYLERCGGDLLAAFDEHGRAGSLELITCAATHGFLPSLLSEPGSVRAQIFTAVREHERLFGVKPKGMWLPECGYFPGVDAVLAEAGVRYTFLDTHGIEHARPKPLFGVNAPLYCDSGVAVFARHPATSKLVWSSMVGYPSDPQYREHYRDIGFELDQGYLAPFQYAPGVRTATGIKYHRITGPGPNKQLYNPDRGRDTASRHARDFVARCRDQVARASHRMPFPAVVVSPYDAELFGHWWFEGPQWIYSVLREVASGSGDLVLSTPSEYLDAYPVQQRATPAPSSWGKNGYSEHWLNSKTAWLWRPLHDAYLRLQPLLQGEPRDPESPEGRALSQACRELLLAQDSDWAFAITSGTTEQYARRRFLDHVERFHDLAGDLEQQRVDPDKLAALELMDAVLPAIDSSHFASPSVAP